MTLAACGYRLAGSGELPGGVERIAINLLVNRSTENGIETTITNALIDEFTRRQQAVVPVQEAQATVSGTINSISWDTLSRRGVNAATERRVDVMISLVLKGMDGKVLWQSSGLTAKQAYAVVSGDKPATDANRRQAIELAVQRIAETAYRRMVDNF
jgi:hypothetical protein